MAFTKVSAALNAVLAVVFVAVVLRHNSYNNAEQLSSALATRAAITPRVMVAHVPRAFAPQVVGCKQTNLRRHQASPSMRSLLVHAGEPPSGWHALLGHFIGKVPCAVVSDHSSFFFWGGDYCACDSQFNDVVSGVSHAPPPVADTTQKFHGKFK